MSVLLITGPHQSGKTSRAWQLVRQQPLGSAVLVGPQGTFSREQALAWHAHAGPGALPVTIALDQLFASLGGRRRPAGSPSLAAHVARQWCSQGRLLRTPLAAIAEFRATASDLADTCLRLDAHRIADDDLALAGRALRQSHPTVVEKLIALTALRAELGSAPQLPRGRWLSDLAQSELAVRWEMIVCDDLINLTPAELAVLAALGRTVRLVITAVDDGRLGHGALLERLRSTFPGAVEERLTEIHAQAPAVPAVRHLLRHALTDTPLGEEALAFYHYRDDTHAGRAIAAWLARSGTSPGEASLYVRTAGSAALTLADALIGCGVAVQGSFTVPLASTALGGLLRRLGRWCATPSWEHFLEVCERLVGLPRPSASTGPLTPNPASGASEEGDLLPDGQPPFPPRQLLGPWGSLPAEQAVARLAQLRTGEAVDDHEWNEPQRRAQPWLTASIAWVRAWLQVLTPPPGSWLERLTAISQRLALPLDESLVAWARELAAHAPIELAEFDERVAQMTVTIERGAGDDPRRCLRIIDAVRGRSTPRPVVIIHGLEHGRWPAQARRGVCLSRQERRLLVGALDGRDPWDEAGQASGELAAVLAVLARATRLVVCGIPCGEREPSPLLATLCAQAGRNLVSERSRVASEAVPGAPLGPADSLGAHETALWGTPPSRPHFRFVLPPRPCDELGLSPSRLNDLLRDPFAFVLGTLGIDPPLSNAQRRADGRQLHHVLERLGTVPPGAWTTMLDTVVEEWIALASDPLARAGRQRRRAAILVALQEETALAQGCTVVSERDLDIRIPLPQEPGLAGGALPHAVQLRGKADRIDRLPDGSLRIVDYKYATIAAYRIQTAQGWEGQLAAYAAALLAQGANVSGAYYRALLGGGGAGYAGPASPSSMGRNPCPIAALPERVAAIGAAVADLASGQATTDPANGLCGERGYAPIARLDEARLVVAGEDGDPSESGE